MELVKKEIVLAKVLNDTEKEIVLASQSLRIKGIEKMDLAEALVPSIAEAVLITGERPKTPEDVVQISVNVAQMLKSEAPNIRKEEIKLAIKKGAFGILAEPGEVTFISPKNVLTWVLRYAEHKLTALKKQQSHEYKIKWEAYEEEKARGEIEKFIDNLEPIILAEFEAKERTGEAEEVYKWLNKAGVLIFPTGRKNEILEEWTEKVKTRGRREAKKIFEKDARCIALGKAKAQTLTEWFLNKTRVQMEFYSGKVREFYLKEYKLKD